VEVLVDACQMRISSSTLRAYLEHDFIVAVTGSKFVAGPAFCGALFIPAKAARRLKKSPLPATLAAYSARGDWPQDWPAAALPDVANFGLLLRWEAALTELRAFRALSPDSIRHFLEMFTATIGADIRNEPALELLSTPALDRCAIGAGKGWDQVQTLFPFLLKRPPSSQKQRWLNRDETRKIYELLRTDCSTVSSEIAATVLATRCEVGQPVACGLRDGILVSALRLGLSTRLIVDALSPQGRGAGPVLADAICVLKKAAWLASRSS